MRKFSLVLSYVSLLFLGSCGLATNNSFKSLEKEDAAQDAAHEMEQDRPQEAIVILERALQSDPENYVLISLLSAAYAQKYGVDLITIALKMASPEEEGAALSGTTSSNPMTALWAVLPEASDENLEGVDHAVSLLMSIPLDARREADSFKLGILSTVAASLQLKALDLNGDGELSVQELLALDATSAEAVLTSLLGAVQATAALSGASDANSSKVSEQIGSVYENINSADGETDAERLSAYLRKS